MTPEQIHFRRLDPAATIPTRANPGDAGLDLYALGGGSIPPGGREMVGTGVAVAIPDGCAGLVTPRSGLAAKHGIAIVNAPGVIDSGYRGELRVILLNTDPEAEFNWSAGDRIAQLLIVPVALPSAVEVEELPDSTRDTGGFGSSGR